MDDQIVERIHKRIDETHNLINDVKLCTAVQTQEVKTIKDTVETFVRKVDESIYHPEDGFIVRTKIKLSSICTQLKNQWYLITLLLVGILGISLGVISELYKIKIK